MENLNECKPEEPQETPKVENVGEAFISWAENGWAFEKIITSGLKNIENEGGESCPYKYLREVFVDKINELSKNQAIESQPKL